MGIIQIKSMGHMHQIKFIIAHYQFVGCVLSRQCVGMHAFDLKLCATCFGIVWQISDI